MIPVVCKQTMQALDAHMIAKMHIPSLLLMENAAHGITAAICAMFGTDTKIVTVCGIGNNGGDGFAAARQLSAKGYEVSVYLIGQKEKLKGDAATNAAFFDQRIIELTDDAQAMEHFSDLKDCVVIDAIFGIGLCREVTGLFTSLINLINNSGAYIVACDIATGIDANTGAVLGTAIQADETVTFQCAKPGHFLYPGRAHTGTLTVKEIGVTDGFYIGDTKAYADGLTIPKRRPNTHKGSFGKLACVVSSAGLSGAGLMCVGGALKAGAGLTTTGIPASLQDIFCAHTPECMTFALDDFSGSLSEHCTSDLDQLMQGKTALVTGCGLSVTDGTKKAVAHMVQNYDVKKIFDADALNIISQNTDILLSKQGDIVLTPHLVEFSRLCGQSPEEILADPLNIAQDFAKKYGITLLLKGTTTIVTDGEKTAFVLTGTPGMAKGGSGDVLSGVIGGLLAGGIIGGMNCFDAALYGAYICGKAGEAAAEAHGELSMTALDTLAHVGIVIKDITV